MVKVLSFITQLEVGLNVFKAIKAYVVGYWVVEYPWRLLPI